MAILKLTGFDLAEVVPVFFPVVAIVVIVGEWLSLGFVRRRYQNTQPRIGMRWPIRRVTACALLIALSLIAFPMAWFAFLASFGASFQILWASAIVLIASGLLGLVSAARVIVGGSR